MEKIMKDPAVEVQMRKVNLLREYHSPEATWKLMDKDFKMITSVVQKLGIGK